MSYDNFHPGWKRDKDALRHLGVGDEKQEICHLLTSPWRLIKGNSWNRK